MKSLTTVVTVLTVFMISPVCAVEQHTITYSTTVPLAISVEVSGTPPQATPGEIMSMQWLVHSNNAFHYQFSGTAKDETGNELNYPLLYKQEMSASGNPVPDQYEVLDTKFGVVVENYGSIQHLDNWGNGKLAAGAATDLVKAPTDPKSPSGSMGRIMPADTTNQAIIELYAKGITDNADQSGLYNSSVILTVIADEQ